MNFLTLATGFAQSIGVSLFAIALGIFACLVFERFPRNRPLGVILALTIMCVGIGLAVWSIQP